MAWRVAACIESACIPPQLCTRASEHPCDIYAIAARLRCALQCLQAV
jgi:hypothetical protein